MTFKPRFRPGKNKKCWCGSGRKAKNCHGLGTGPKPVIAVAQHAPPAKPPVVQAPWGVPGEEHKLWVVPVLKDQPREMRAEDVIGKPGIYKVQILLSRPGYPVVAEREHKFIDSVVGDSHIAIAKPTAERKPEDCDHLLLEAFAKGRQVRFIGLPNERGYLGKLIVDRLDASGFQDAECVAYEAVAPFLSAWSVHLDIPVHTETIQITNLETHTHSLRVRTPQFEMTFAGGVTPVLSDEFCHYASMYREGLNSNSSFYRFLCFFKIIEGILYRRSRLDKAIKDAGGTVRRVHERLPDTRDELVALLGDVYPWRKSWDEMALNQVFPKESWGKKVTYIRDHHLNPLRVGIAHALLKTGEVRITLDCIEHIQGVNQWLALCRVLARIMLRNEFPTEFGLKMMPLATGQRGSFFR